MKKMKKLFMLMLLGIFVFFTTKSDALASDLQRSYYKVVSGTATKLGSENQEQVSTKAYLEEWEVPKEMVLAEDVAEILLKSSNVGELPIEIDKLDYSTLKELAEKGAEGVEIDTLYQGYARLGLTESNAGYTYGILIEEDSVSGNYTITGYYTDLNLDGIYKIELICTRSNTSEIFKVLKNVSKDNNSESSSESSIEPSTPPKPPTPPAPPTPPGGPIEEDDPTPPSPVIPGPTDESTTPEEPSDDESTSPVIPAPPAGAPIEDEPTPPSAIIPGTMG